MVTLNLEPLIFGDTLSPKHGAWLETEIKVAKKKFLSKMHASAYYASRCLWDHAARERIMARQHAQQWLALRRLRPAFDDHLSDAGDDLRTVWFNRFPRFKEQLDKEWADFRESCRLAYNAANPDKAY